MSKLKSFIVWWLPVAVWLAVISTASGDKKSFEHSSRIIGPVVHWLFPGLSQSQVDEVVFYVRKCAHMTEFGVLALLCWRGLRKTTAGERKPWSGRDAVNAMMFVLMFASADEFHQMFVPSRQASVIDVMIDCSGGLIALGCWRVLGRWRNWW